MATRSVCDRCNELEAGAVLSKVGIVEPGEFCPECTSAVHDYLRAVDILHEQVASYWQAELTKLRQEYGVEHCAPC